MATIDTVRDIIRLMRDDPEVLAEIRRVIVTDDLMAVPGQIAEILVEIRDMRETSAAHTAALRDLRERSAAHSGGLADQARTLRALAEAQADQARILREQSTTLRQHGSAIGELRNDVRGLRADIW